MKFSELTIKWKALSIMGVIFTLLCIGLIILLVIMFKTDLILWPDTDILSSEEINEEFEDFLNQFDNSNSNIIKEEYYKHLVRDLKGNYINNNYMTDIKIIK